MAGTCPIFRSVPSQPLMAYDFLSWIAGEEQHLQCPGGEWGIGTKNLFGQDPWENRNLLIKGSSDALKYSSWFNWQSCSPSAVGLGWWMGHLPGLIICGLGQVSFEGREEGGKTLPLGLPVVSARGNGSFLRGSYCSGDFTVAGESMGWMQQDGSS